MLLVHAKAVEPTLMHYCSKLQQNLTRSFQAVGNFVTEKVRKWHSR